MLWVAEDVQSERYLMQLRRLSRFKFNVFSKLVDGADWFRSIRVQTDQIHIETVMGDIVLVKFNTIINILQINIDIDQNCDFL